MGMGRGEEAEKGIPRIRPLPEELIRLIAAGEVIERPASVVKELVENSLDAGAREVVVTLEGGGLRRIEVADDGIGILPEDLPLAIQRHATSKVPEGRGLQGVSTLGFRGEALAAIAAVSRLRIVSRVADQPTAYGITHEEGRTGPVEPAGRGPGTTVEVRDLFHATPARRKFLGTESIEGLRVLRLLERMYLCRPSVRYVLRSEGREIARYPATLDLREAAVAVFGRALRSGSFEFRGSGGPGVWVRGIASHPSVSRRGGSGVVTAVNGRLIQEHLVQEACREAYGDLLPGGRSPVVILHVEVDPSRVDVNVHPAKREVRWENPKDLRENLVHILRSRLAELPRAGVPLSLLPVWQRAGREDLPGPLAPIKPAPEGWTSAQTTPFVAPLPEGGEEVPALRGTGGFPSLRILGQVGALYLVTEDLEEPGTLVLVDAHAASERIGYERLGEELREARQVLLQPYDLELTPRQQEALRRHRAELERWGFEIDPFGGASYRVRSVPTLLGLRGRPEQVGELLEELADGGRGVPGDSEFERRRKTVACHMAIRAGDRLDLAEMRRLLQTLSATPRNFSCPHGRPILVRVPRPVLNQWFRRP
jgi:DNA mismatch repair protein MutL